MIERLDKIRDEIESLEEADMSWANLEKLSVLYNIEHHMCKRMGMTESVGGNYSDSEIGFHSRNTGMNGGSGGELRELANGMTKQALTEVIVGYGKELGNSGNRRNYDNLYQRMQSYSEGSRGGNGNGNGR